MTGGKVAARTTHDLAQHRADAGMGVGRAKPPPRSPGEGNGGGTMTDTWAGVRIGDAEREATAGLLGDHYAAGRLTYAELDERLDAVWRAQSATDLGTLLVDLPSTGGAVEPARRAGVGAAGADPRGRRGFAPGMPPWPLIIVAIVVAGIVVPGPPWPLFVLFWVWVLIGRRRMFIGWDRRPDPRCHAAASR